MLHGLGARLEKMMGHDVTNVKDGEGMILAGVLKRFYYL
jgi:hypothetical protein